MYRYFGLLSVFAFAIFLFTYNTFENGEIRTSTRSLNSIQSAGPVVINTWGLVDATKTAYSVLKSSQSPLVHLDALEAGLHYCEVGGRCGWSVGEGGSPDEQDETTLDAAIINGDNMDVGVVAGLRRCNNAIGVARLIMETTKHTILAGDLATQFALEMGFNPSDLHSNSSIEEWKKWKTGKCQPNYRKNVIPDATTSCGPYKPARDLLLSDNDESRPRVDSGRHDTIGMVVLSPSSSIGAGASTNGATWKVPGRVGDVGIVGAGSYADSRVGGCAATGDGDIMMRFLPCFLAIENLRNGMPLQNAADRALLRVAEFFPNFQGALVVITSNGQYTGSAYGWTFEYAVMTPDLSEPKVVQVPPINGARISKN